LSQSKATVNAFQVSLDAERALRAIADDKLKTVDDERRQRESRLQADAKEQTLKAEVLSRSVAELKQQLALATARESELKRSLLADFEQRLDAKLDGFASKLALQTPQREESKGGVKRKREGKDGKADADAHAEEPIAKRAKLAASTVSDRDYLCKLVKQERFGKPSPLALELFHACVIQSASSLADPNAVLYSVSSSLMLPDLPPLRELVEQKPTVQDDQERLMFDPQHPAMQVPRNAFSLSELTLSAVACRLC
jgi:hypothetical protein